LLSLAARACPICQGELPEPSRFADAIYRIEGAGRAKVPFGILSVPVRSFDHARSLCEATVARQWVRWSQAGRRECYLVSLANRYCPPSHDPVGNRNWLRNICNALAMQVSSARRHGGSKAQQTREFSVGTPPA